VSQGEIVGLLGPNGAGKTTTFYMIVGLVQPNSGEIFLDNQNITDMAMYERAQLGVGYLPQEASVFRKLSVEDNIKAVLEMTKLSKKEQEMKQEELIEEFGLGHVRKNRGDFLKAELIARNMSTTAPFNSDKTFADTYQNLKRNPQYIHQLSKLKKTLNFEMKARQPYLNAFTINPVPVLCFVFISR